MNEIFKSFTGGDSLATLDDIAQQLGVSKATVSKALNGAKDVSKKMQQAVVEKAVELGYSRLNYSTAAPRIAVFIINMDYKNPDDFGYDIIVGFRKAAEPAGFIVNVIPLTRQLQDDFRYDEYMMRENYVGALFLGMCLLDPWIREFETCKTPTVLYDNRVSCNPKVTSIGIDNVEGIRLAINHLREQGHRKIGYLGSALAMDKHMTKLEPDKKLLRRRQAGWCRHRTHLLHIRVWYRSDASVYGGNLPL